MNRRQHPLFLVRFLCIAISVLIAGCSANSPTTTTPALTPIITQPNNSYLTPKGITVPEVSCDQAYQLITQNKIKDLTLVESSTSDYPQDIQLILRSFQPGQADGVDVFVPLLKDQVSCATKLTSTVKSMNKQLPKDEQISITILEAN